MADQILNSIKGRNSVANLQKKMVEFCPFILKIWSKYQILALIKGHYSVANLRQTTIYNTNIDLVNEDVYTKFGLILSIRSQDIE